MAGLTGKVALILTALFLLPLGLLRARPYDSAAMQVFLTPPAGCLMPCWEGIQPGTTTVAEALRILETHPWVTDVRGLGRQISWGWTGAQPAFIDSATRGSLSTFWDRVTSIRLATHLQSGDVLLSGSQPRAVAYIPLSGTHFITHMALYDHFMVYALMTCPLTTRAIWQQPADLIMDVRVQAFDARTQHFDNYQEPLWRRTLPDCER